MALNAATLLVLYIGIATVEGHIDTLVDIYLDYQQYLDEDVVATPNLLDTNKGNYVMVEKRGVDGERQVQYECPIGSEANVASRIFGKNDYAGTYVITCCPKGTWAFKGMNGVSTCCKTEELGRVVLNKIKCGDRVMTAAGNYGGNSIPKRLSNNDAKKWAFHYECPGDNGKQFVIPIRSVSTTTAGSYHITCCPVGTQPKSPISGVLYSCCKPSESWSKFIDIKCGSRIMNSANNWGGNKVPQSARIEVMED